MINVNNGARVDVSLSDYQGAAGFVVMRDESAQLSYRSTKPKGPTVGTVVMIEDAQWEVVAAARSDFVADFRVLTLKRLEA